MRITAFLVTLLLCLAPDVAAQCVDINSAPASELERIIHFGTGPRTVAGKARVARNAYRGGERQRLRELVRVLNAYLKRGRESIAHIVGDHS